ncbi:MAG: response regulator [bacterium]
MQCRSCQAVLNEGDLFCPSCGARVQLICNRCGSNVKDEDLFCRKCGASLKDIKSLLNDPTINVAKAIAHRINNMLSVALTNSQIAKNQIRNISKDADQKMHSLLQEIISSISNSGKIIHLFQEFLNSIENEHNYSDMSKYANQILIEIEKMQTPKITINGVKSKSEDNILLPKLGNISILIIDDEDMVRHALSYALTLGGYHVITAANGKEGMEFIKSKFYDIAFVDLKMPDIDGWEVTKFIRSVSPDTTTILMTGWGIQLDDKRLQNGNVDAILAKPFQISQISELIEVVINGREKHMKV